MFIISCHHFAGRAGPGILGSQVSWVSGIPFLCSYVILHDCCELAFDTIQQL